MLVTGNETKNEAHLHEPYENDQTHQLDERRATITRKELRLSLQSL